ncbi:MAG: glycosyltransferase family 2 protein [bacterium]
MISVVIPNWNGINFIGMCLDSFKGQKFKDYEIIVVDNGSTDGSRELLKDKYPFVRLIELPENLGFAKACNEGIKTSKGEYICLLNNDIEVDDLWLKELYEGMERYPQAGMGASKMLFFDQRDIIYNAGDTYHIWGTGGPRGQGEKDDGRYDREEYIFGACAGAGIYRKKLFEDIGFFDEDFFIFAEDVDLNYRSQLSGYKCVYLSKARVYHIGTATVGLYSNMYVYLCSRNDIYVMIKDTPLQMYFKNIGKILNHQLESFNYFSTRGQGVLLLKGKIAVLKNLSKMLKRRYRIQKSKKVSNKYLEEVIIMSSN